MNKVQILTYCRDITRPANYLQCQEQPKLFFNWFMLNPAREKTLRNRNAEFGIETFIDEKRVFITGLIPIKNIGFENLFFGDINGDTIGFWISQDKEIIKIVLFKGHKPKFRKSREKMVTNYINECKISVKC
jgi:hypothetical protein